jgi:aspartate carbamoyltransferase
MANKIVKNAAKPSLERLEVLKNRDILSASELNKEELMIILETAAYYERVLIEKRKVYDMDNKIMASIFFEPSTRTRLSFETAMHRLGGSVITVAESEQIQISSTSKGESIADSIKVIDGYADIIVVRSPVKGAADEAAKVAEKPVINAGDGFGQHPTQALLDMYTILKEKKNLEGLTIGLLGDLKYGRTVHSLVDFFSLFNCNLVFISPDELKMPKDITQNLQKKGIDVKESDNLQDIVDILDVLYVTRIQRERFEDRDEYERVKNAYVVDESIIDNLKKETIILHPLPRVNEIAVGVDKYSGAAYFRQAKNGVPTRMAILSLAT